MTAPNRLLVVSHTPHYRRGGQFVGWGPTVRELDYLAELFDELVHIAPVYDEAAPDSALPYASTRVRLRAVPPAGGERLSDKAGILRVYPAYARVIGEEIKEATAVHVRCPANISLLALLVLMRRPEPRPRWIKYAGNWQPDGGDDPWSYRLQRRILERGGGRWSVTVNGRWPGQPSHVTSFFNPSLTDEEVAQGRALAPGKRLGDPVEILFVGALNDGKGAGRALEVALRLQQMGVAANLHFLGDGPDRPRYEAWVMANSLRGVTFHGWVPRGALPPYYAAAHIILLPSQSEGWPKVLSEAMAYGTVPVASAVSSIPQVLAETAAGTACQSGDVDAFARAIRGYVEAPDTWQAASQAGVAAASRFTYHSYQHAVADLFARDWGVELKRPALAGQELSHA